MTPYENTVAANEYNIAGLKRPVDTDYNHEKNFFIVIILIEVLALIVAASV